ncbi:MAG: hypothetical protein QM564_11415 [Bergeyella sp.]
MKKIFIGSIVMLLAFQSFKSQRILSEQVNSERLEEPKTKLNLGQNNYKFTIHIPYTMKAEDLEKVAKEEFQDKLANYDNVVKQSEIDYQEALKNHENDVKEAKEKFKLESDQFAKLSLLERLALTESGNKPQLKLPSKPVYVKPSKPTYQEPNISNYLIFDKNVMESKMELKGFNKGENGINFVIDFNNMEFQDNANQVYGKQPTVLKVMTGGNVVEEKVFSDDFELITSGSTNSIRRNYYENQNVNKILSQIQSYVNDVYGFKSKTIGSTIFYIKNKGEYDDLEKAKINAVSGFTKLKINNSADTKAKGLAEINKALETWKAKLPLVKFKDKDAIYNAVVGQAILFNLVGVYVDLNDKKSAEEYFQILQDNKIYMKLDYDDNRYYKLLETSINEMK